MFPQTGEVLSRAIFFPTPGLPQCCPDTGGWELPSLYPVASPSVPILQLRTQKLCEETFLGSTEFQVAKLTFERRDMGHSAPAQRN